MIRELPDNEAALLTALQKLDHIARPANEGVRIMAPTGELGYVPQENLEEALAAGARVMTPDDMRALRQQVFMEYGLFKDAHKRPDPKRRKRLVRSGRR